ncbi:hypothetical protein CVT24_010209 [Panaeolus cyanescens]|uniref:Zinc/iron permease n=1 Tax=Panaeolus cyanescens TaxID=181874 RepID=A0A409YPT7_9AGAR|nr:hypothetical protein CVT24_010209 [Panaeolus cyanescens]
MPFIPKHLGTSFGSQRNGPLQNVPAVSAQVFTTFAMAAYWELGSKLSVMVIILIVSLFGVILATAFLHLLDDAFKSLQDPIVSRKYGHVGKWTGLIILGSLLAIFLVEYISTSYVNHLHGKPSAPSTPVSSRNVSPSPPPSPPRSAIPPIKQVTSKRKRQLSNTSQTSSLGESSSEPPNESTPLLIASRPVNPNKPLTSPPDNAEILAVAPHPKRGLTIPLDASGGTLLAAPTTQSRSRSPPRASRQTTRTRGSSRRCRSHSHSHSHADHHHLHPGHHLHGPIIPVAAVAGVPIEVLTNSPRIFRLGLSHDHHHHHHHHHHEEDGHHSTRAHSICEPDDTVQQDEPDHHHHHHHHATIGRRRQIVGILVLQLGIMIHSLVIGLTLAVTYGSEFTSLTTAIIFHQLFEGLSLGIRIAALPPPPGQTHKVEEQAGGTHRRRISEGSDTTERGRSKAPAGHLGSPTNERRGYDAVSSTPKPASPHPHPLTQTMTSATSSSTDTTSTTTTSTHVSSSSTGSTTSGTNATANVPTPTCAPQAKGKACAYDAHKHESKHGWESFKAWTVSKYRKIHWLKPTLSVLFAITTPLGMALGMWMWGAKSDAKSPDMLLTQGVMSAISAGLLIYAATVEMIAGDFVFGDVEGGHHHHHHHDEGAPQGFISPPPQEGGPLLDEEEVLGKVMQERFRELESGHVRGGGRDGVNGHAQIRGTVQMAPPEKHESSVKKKVLAVVSMFAGVAGMVLVGLGE